MKRTRRRMLGEGALAILFYAFSPLLGLAESTHFDRLILSDDEWKKRLTPAQYNILRKAGTEAPYSSPLLGEHRVGKFACAGCALALFDSSTKFESHTGWPSFYRAIAQKTINHEDRSMIGEVRTEVRCARCDGHLGHVFEDGPAPTGLRYCMNGLALTFHRRMKT